MSAFFFEYKKEISQHFEVLFDSGDGEADEFSSKWGWYPVLYNLASEDILKMDKVSELSVRVVFTHLAYLKDLKYKIERDKNGHI